MVDYDISQGKFADPDKTAGGGWSYGGNLHGLYRTEHAIYRRAISGAGAAEFPAVRARSIPEGLFTELGYPGQKQAVWTKLGPFLRYKNHVRRHVHGGNSDGTCRSWWEQMYQALKFLGRDTERLCIRGGVPEFNSALHIEVRCETLSRLVRPTM